MSKPPITYAELQKQLAEEIEVLLKIEQMILEDYGTGRRPGDTVDAGRIKTMQAYYRGTGPEETSDPQPAGLRRARISC